MNMSKRKTVFEPGDGFDKNNTARNEPAADSAVYRESTPKTRELKSTPVKTDAAIYDEPYMLIPELAEHLGKSVTVVRRYIDAGFFPNHYKDGPFQSSKIRVPCRDIDNFKATMVRSKTKPASNDGDASDAD